MYRIKDDWMVFNGVFNEPLTNVVFPVSIQKIKFGYYFNQEINNLPNNITHLIFGWKFNQDVSELPNSLTYLDFGHNFNQDVSQLPNSLTCLMFWWDFDQDISRFPKSLIYIQIFKYEFEHSLNPYLYHLTGFELRINHKHKAIMENGCKINQHNTTIREDNLIDLLLKN